MITKIISRSPLPCVQGEYEGYGVIMALEKRGDKVKPIIRMKWKYNGYGDDIPYPLYKEVVRVLYGIRNQEVNKQLKLF